MNDHQRAMELQQVIAAAQRGIDLIMSAVTQALPKCPDGCPNYPDDCFPDGCCPHPERLISAAPLTKAMAEAIQLIEEMTQTQEAPESGDPVGAGLDIGPIERREREATRGPWIYDDQADLIICKDGIILEARHGNGRGPENAAFAALARSDIPALVGEIKRLRSRIAALQKPTEDPADPSGNREQHV